MGDNSPVAPVFEGKSPSSVRSGVSLLGFCTMVAPTVENAGQGISGFGDQAIQRNVQHLPGAVHASAALAPPLRGVIRAVLETRGVGAQGIEIYLNQLKSLPRYDRAFRLFWGFCEGKKVDPTSLEIEQVASLLLEFHVQSPHQARHAYAALLLLPQFSQLRFSPVLGRLKRLWNSQECRYAAFFDATSVLRLLAEQSLDMTNIAMLRGRLILQWRFLMLARSIDLARLHRTVSFVGGDPYILWQRKGWPRARWERVIVLENNPEMCPWKLLRAYVALTASFIPPRGFVFVTLKPPFKPLSANAIGSITREELRRLGIPVNVWKPHSTRGAGVGMYKKLGMSSEEVCEIGQWKNVGAFTSHYLRLGAKAKASELLAPLVHMVSSGQCAEPDLTRTPGTQDTGGSVREGVAHGTDEIHACFRHCSLGYEVFSLVLGCPLLPLSLSFPAVGG